MRETVLLSIQQIFTDKPKDFCIGQPPLEKSFFKFKLNIADADRVKGKVLS